MTRVPDDPADKRTALLSVAQIRALDKVAKAALQPLKGTGAARDQHQATLLIEGRRALADALKRSPKGSS